MSITNVPVFIVSLKNSERRNTISKKLNGFDYEFTDAVYGKDFLPEIEILNNNVQTRARYKRAITPGEYGCSMSHRAIYKRMIKENIDWAIILEDDVDFTFNFQMQIRESIHDFDDNSLYLLGCQEGLPSFDHVVISNKKVIEYKKISFRKTLKSERYVYRTAAYLISKKTAANILNFSDDKFCLADDWSTYSRNHLFDNIFLGNFISHPDVLEGQSTIEGERLLEENLSEFRKSRLFFFLRNIKKNLRQVIIKSFYDI